jgi:hypothetical protein
MYEKMSAFSINEANVSAEKPAATKRPAQGNQDMKFAAAPAPKASGARPAGRNGKSTSAATFKAAGNSNVGWKQF